MTYSKEPGEIYRDFYLLQDIICFLSLMQSRVTVDFALCIQFCIFPVKNEAIYKAGQEDGQAAPGFSHLCFLTVALKSLLTPESHCWFEE